MYSAHGPSGNMSAFQQRRTAMHFIEETGCGSKGLSVAFDLATHRGYDSDHLGVKAMLGRQGGHRHCGGYENPFSIKFPDQMGFHDHERCRFCPSWHFILSLLKNKRFQKKLFPNHPKRHPKEFMVEKYLHLPSYSFYENHQ